MNQDLRQTLRTANVFALGAGRPLWESGATRLGFRLSAEVGAMDGDFTCPEDAAEAGDDPDANPYDCEAASNDEMEFAVFALELSAARRFTRWPRAEAWVTGAVRHVDGTFQVDRPQDVPLSDGAPDRFESHRFTSTDSGRNHRASAGGPNSSRKSAGPV